MRLLEPDQISFPQSSLTNRSYPNVKSFLKHSAEFQSIQQLSLQLDNERGDQKPETFCFGPIG